MKEKAYVVCAKPRVVLFGYATPEEIAKDHPTLRRARMLVYWSADCHGVPGTAANGPTPSCRVSPAVEEWQVRDQVEGVMLCSSKAIEAWESELWG